MMVDDRQMIDKANMANVNYWIQVVEWWAYIHCTIFFLALLFKNFCNKYMAKNIAQIQDEIWLNVKKAQMSRGLVGHNYSILRLFRKAQNVTQTETADGMEMLRWHQIQLLEPQRHWGAVSAVGADNEADQTGIYGSRASGNDLQKGSSKW